MIRDRGPTEIDRRGSDCLLHRGRPFICHWRSNHRRGHDNSLTAHFWSRLTTGNLDIYVSLEPIALHRFATNRTELIVIRTFVDDRCVFISDVRDVGGLIDDRHVALRRQERLLNSRRAEFSTCDETVLVGTDVVIIVRPIANACALVEACLGRQRRPADVVTALAPRNPRRRPLIPRDPNPADSAQTSPAPIVIRSPAEWFLGNPGPARIGINPATVGVGPPTQTGRFSWMKNVAVIAGLDPVTVWLELVVKS